MPTRQQGFTLIELIIVIVLSGALSIVVMQFITAPIEAYIDQTRRARLVDQARLVMQKVADDVRRAVPNSIRVGCGGSCVEFMRAATGGRYRAGLPGDLLSFVPADADTSFEVLGGLNHTETLVTSSDPDACREGRASCVVVYNTGFAGTDLWRGDNAATLTALSAGPPYIVGFDNSVFPSGLAAFPAGSPGQRFFITDTPLVYLCDPVGGTMRRYWGYAPQAALTDADTHAELLGLSNPAEHALLADSVAGCAFRYSPGTPTRNALLTLEVSIAEAGERVTLLEQVGVSNLP
jgi:MSHA biogenesis protein MshO